MVNPEPLSKLSSSVQSGAMKSLLPLFNKNSNNNKARSLYIYLKLFILLPLKYLILLYIFIIIYYLLNEAYKYGMMAYNKIIGFFKLLIVCAEMKKCSKKNKGKNCCELNLIVFTVPDVFKLFMGLLDFLLGFVYFCVTIALMIASAICLIPFSIILPHYRAIL